MLIGSRALSRWVVRVTFFVALFACSCNLVAQQLGVSAPPQSYTRNQGFVLGDAFFSVSEDALVNWETASELDSDQLIVPYSFPRTTHAPVGGGIRFFGFQEIKITGLGQDQRHILSVFLAALRKEAHANRVDDPRHLTFEFLLDDLGRNSRICVVNKDFNLTDHLTFIRYNEQWDRNPTAVELRKLRLNSGDFDQTKSSMLGFGYYGPFIHNSEAIVEDWRNASNVKPLEVSIPDLLSLQRNKRGDYAIIEPVTVSFADVALVGIPGEFDDTRLPNRLNSVIIVLKDDRVARFRWVLQDDEKALVEDSGFIAERR